MLRFLFLPLFFLALTCSQVKAADTTATATDVNLSNRNLWFNFDTIINDFYAARGYAPVWTDSGGPNEKAAQLFKTIVNASQEGLYPDDYHASEIDLLWYLRTPESISRLEFLLTNSLLRYLTDINIGRVNPCMLNPELFSEVRSTAIDLHFLLRKSIESENLELFLSSQLPQHEEYKLLKNTLFRYRKLAETAQWPSIPEGVTIKPGMHDSRVPAIRQRLLTSPVINTIPYNQGELYTESLVAAIKKFQYRFNLETDGIIGKKTLAALNIPIEDLIKRILINMERWRWLPREMARKQLLVNIAGFSLSAFENSVSVLNMPVIVGKKYQKTPVFTDTMRYIVINPYWNIPDNIAAKKIVAEQKADPEYVIKNSIRIFDSWQDDALEISPELIDWENIGSKIRKYRLRQDPGPDNALGRIKFMFPNKHQVYLHDTPGKNLFDEHQRAFSHGCIRVSNPLALALYVLKDNNKPWSLEQIQTQINSGVRKVVLLDQPVGIHILYRTVAVDPATEEVVFYQDIYGRDKLLVDSFFTENNENICLYPFQ